MALLNRIHCINAIAEMELAIGVIEKGIHIGREAGDPKLRLFLFCLLVGSGLERLMKLVVSFQVWKRDSFFPEPEKLKRKYGHDLIKLRHNIVSISVRSRQEREFLTSERISSLLQVLTDFANKDRYSYLDASLSLKTVSTSFLSKWAVLFEAPLFSEDEYLTDLKTTGMVAIRNKSIQAATDLIEEMVGIIARVLIQYAASPDLDIKVPSGLRRYA